VTTDLRVNKRISWLGTVRARLGWLAIPTFLVYGTGGFAYGEVKSSTDINTTLNGPGISPVAADIFSSSGNSLTRGGWTAGGGVEWMFLPRWSLKAEYLYYDLGTVSYDTLIVDPITVPYTPPNYFVNNAHTTTRFNGNIARLGVNYHF
jgi:outer membrane immunogenic protein